MPYPLEHPVETTPRPTIVSGRFALALLAVAIAFGIAYTQNPLYTGNQNSYFLHGLASSGLGFLSDDWIANTVDPFPLFSWLADFTVTVLHPSAFYLCHALLLGIYLFAILGIARKTFGLNSSGGQFFFCVLLITGLHSAALADLSEAIVGMNPAWVVELGVAQQSIIGHELLPGTVGVFLPLSIYAFLLGRPIAAVLCPAIAGTFHASYVPSALLLTIVYAGVILRREANRRSGLLTIALGIALLLPALLYIITMFSPTTAEQFARSQSILAHFRMPHHTDPGIWFNKQALGVLVVMLVGLYLARQKSIFPLLLIPFLVGLGLTIIYALWPNDTLALLFPWRFSAWLLPVSWGVIIGAVTSALFMREGRQGTPLGRSVNLAGLGKSMGFGRRSFDLAILSAVFLFALYGGWKMYHAFQVQPSAADEEALMQFVCQNAAPNQTYLVPVHLEQFRLRTGVPILVDWKTHPYKDAEVIEWYQRMQMAEKFFGRDNDFPAQVLHDIREQYSVTHVVLPAGAAAVRSADLLKIYSNTKYEVYQLSDLPAPGHALPPPARTP